MPAKPYWAHFPNLFPDVISDEVARKIPWHKHADSSRSSQVFCVSAFGFLLRHRMRDRIVGDFLQQAFGWTTSLNNKWIVELEFVNAKLLNELGHGTPTQVDTLFVGSNAVVTLESKFATDAKDGLGCCTQYIDKKCGGYHGPGSDLKCGTTAWCRLDNWDGRRTPRAYWLLGKTFFQPSVLLPQKPDQPCPFRDGHYQLMRNFLLAAAYAQSKKKTNFGTVVICPRSASAKLREQVRSFQTSVLLNDYRDRVQLAFYDDYISLLKGLNDHDATAIATFLQCRMDAERNPGAPAPVQEFPANRPN